jgi:hypothetical protein
MTTEVEQRAARAEQIVNDPLFEEAWEACMGQAIDELTNARLSDAAGLQAAAARLQALNQVRDQMHSFMTTGAMAARPRPSVA